MGKGLGAHLPLQAARADWHAFAKDAPSDVYVIELYTGAVEMPVSSGRRPGGADRATNSRSHSAMGESLAPGLHPLPWQRISRRGETVYLP